jgi:hypothetical protein
VLTLPDIAEQLSRLVGAPVTLTFALILAVHIVAGLTCVVTGAVALLSRKSRGRHPAYGEVYYWALAVVFATATAMAGMRWAESAYLFVLGCVAFGFGSLAYAAGKRRWPGWLTMHMLGMSLSYIVLLTAFYVDNGPKLPLWDRLPTLAFWLGPSLIGLPLLARALVRNGRAFVDLRASALAACELQAQLRSRRALAGPRPVRRAARGSRPSSHDVRDPRVRSRIALEGDDSRSAARYRARQ